MDVTYGSPLMPYELHDCVSLVRLRLLTEDDEDDEAVAMAAEVEETK